MKDKIDKIEIKIPKHYLKKWNNLNKSAQTIAIRSTKVLSTSYLMNIIDFYHTRGDIKRKKE
jgi:hypothetical protein